MLEYFDGAKVSILNAVGDTLAAYGQEFAVVSADFGTGVADRLAEFTYRGKLLRGCLVRLGYELASGSAPSGDDERDVVLAGAAMELFQSGLLIHDDIMDGDRLRRGAPTMHIAYESDLRHGRYGEPARTSESLGVCAGDIAYFSAFRLLTELHVSDTIARRIACIAAKELALVGVAQMQDVANGSMKLSSS